MATFADMAIRSPSGLSIASPDEFSKIVNLRLEVESINQRLDRASITQPTATNMSGILDDLDKLSLELLRYSVA